LVATSTETEENISVNEDVSGRKGCSWVCLVTILQFAPPVNVKEESHPLLVFPKCYLIGRET
jgi:hypothetical protein